MAEKSKQQAGYPAGSGAEVPPGEAGGLSASEKAALEREIDRFLFTPRKRGKKRAMAFLEDWMRRYSR